MLVSKHRSNIIWTQFNAQWHGTNCAGTPVYGTAILKIIALCVSIDTQLLKAPETYSGHRLQCSSHIVPLHCQVMVPLPLPTTLKGKGKKAILNVAQI